MYQKPRIPVVYHAGMHQQCQKHACTQLSIPRKHAMHQECSLYACTESPVQACIKKGESAPRAEQLCGNQGCSKDSDCMGAGSCNTPNGTCACAPGFAGPRCAISLGPCNVTQKASLCCNTGVVDRQGTCCSSGILLISSIMLYNNKCLLYAAFHGYSHGWQRKFAHVEDGCTVQAHRGGS